MKKDITICKLLGIKQDDLAMLLNVSKGQLAMYETGKRDLPVTAKLQLATILQYMQEDSDKQDSMATILKAQMVHQKKVLEQMLQTNKYKQLLLEKKRLLVEKKYHSNLSAIKLMQFLKKEDAKNELIKVIESKATADLEKNGLAVLTRFHIEKEVLLAEEKMLRKFLGV